MKKISDYLYEIDERYESKKQINLKFSCDLCEGGLIWDQKKDILSNPPKCLIRCLLCKNTICIDNITLKFLLQED